MIDLKKLAKLRDEVEQAKKQRDRAEGRLDELMGRLLKDHGCKSIEEAEKLSAKKQKQVVEMERAYDAELAKLEREFGDKLEDDE
jgi:predicted  nucleic acid-binding Zn-ribbon protein